MPPSQRGRRRGALIQVKAARRDQRDLGAPERIRTPMASDSGSKPVCGRAEMLTRDEET
ncbi:MAG: hypothetical protein GXC76_09670 [Rhodanobacteraceae bacterium]|jgi:hypothetical protein|nr:hypothetical protein [Rhodanobacteraceae bacterium]